MNFIVYLTRNKGVQIIPILETTPLDGIKQYVTEVIKEKHFVIGVVVNGMRFAPQSGLTELEYFACITSLITTDIEDNYYSNSGRVITFGDNELFSVGSSSVNSPNTIVENFNADIIALPAMDIKVKDSGLTSLAEAQLIFPNCSKFGLVTNGYETLTIDGLTVITTSFKNNWTVTKFDDLGGNITEVQWKSVWGWPLTSIVLPAMVTYANDWMYGNNVCVRYDFASLTTLLDDAILVKGYTLGDQQNGIVNIPKVTVIGADPAVISNVFITLHATWATWIFNVNIALETSNAGGVDATIADLIAKGATVNYIP